MVVDFFCLGLFLTIYLPQTEVGRMERKRHANKQTDRDTDRDAGFCHKWVYTLVEERISLEEF